MKKLLTISVLSAVVASGFTVAHAQDFDQYLSAKAVLNHVNNKFEGQVKDVDGEDSGSFKKSKNVGGFRLAYGAIFPVGDNNVRAEIEYGYNGKVKVSDEDSKSETKSQALMLNGYYDFNTGTAFTPYVGAGIGYARLKNTLSDEELSISKSKGNFAWQVGAGVSYAVNSNVAVDLSYRFMDYGKVSHSYKADDASVNGKVKQRGNEFNLGVRYTF
ncbi:hypothetical protein B9T19_00330 [Ignatzschineria sp. F8392]|uniref:outer membrane protein n=1 Tax=Ignatzschineria sp. F8392 TaxID=1980117 RepID=UPI000B99AE9E|nr:outer membrane protein [Ignatzschineria sp. F8392]OYQ81161.1 hypothetical protein B9T19_00330 [Ignatzschineria sp. F8392]